MHMQTLALLCRSIWKDKDAVTSIEYALLGSLIAVVIVVSVAFVGQGAFGLWAVVKNCVTFSVANTGSCP